MKGLINSTLPHGMTGHVKHFPPYSPDERERFLGIIQGSLGVRRHFDLFCWLQGDLQYFLPHEILLAAWGDLASGQLYVDVISPLPGMRTGPVMGRDIAPFVQDLFAQWQGNSCAPLCLAVPDGFSVPGSGAECSVSHSFQNMRTAIAHGIKDERGQHDCLYVVFGRSQEMPGSAARFMEVLLPHIDTALRQVTHLPQQRKDVAIAPPEAPTAGELGLSEREAEIMDWVLAGKTNQEIGIILDISAFTVKNHLQRIFRKLEVTNRAQAVAAVGRLRRKHS